VSRFLSYVRKHHVALLALFVAMGGTSYAAFRLPRNSVGSRQIQANAVNSGKVANGSLLKRDFKAGQVPAGLQGPKGDNGDKGDKGDACLASDPNCKGPSGDTGPSFGQTFDFVGPPSVSICTDTTLIDKPITLARSSRIYVNGLVSLYANDTGATLDLDVDLRSGDGNTTLANAAALTVRRTQVLTTEMQAATGGVVSDNAASTPYVAKPGTYHLVMHGNKSGTCATTLTYDVGSLTWTELGTAAP
jgi:hypothetical protein